MPFKCRKGSNGHRRLTLNSIQIVVVIFSQFHLLVCLKHTETRLRLMRSPVNIVVKLEHQQHQSLPSLDAAQSWPWSSRQKLGRMASAVFAWQHLDKQLHNTSHVTKRLVVQAARRNSHSEAVNEIPAPTMPRRSKVVGPLGRHTFCLLSCCLNVQLRTILCASPLCTFVTTHYCHYMSKNIEEHKARLETHADVHQLG